MGSAHQRQLDPGGEGLAVVGGLDEDDDGRGHGLGQLVRANRVVLQREVGEGHEAAEAERQQHDAPQWQALGRKHVHLLADVQAQPGDHEVDQGQRHVGEAVAHVDPLVDKDDADGGEQVDQEAGGDAPVGRQVRQHVGDGVWRSASTLKLVYTATQRQKRLYKISSHF